MLKSTYKPSGGPPPLPQGWSKHKAPTGHAYYYNAATKQSTYNWPDESDESIINTTCIAKLDELEPKARPSNLVVFNGTSLEPEAPPKGSFHPVNNFLGKGGFRDKYNDRQRHPLDDRPKSKHEIPDCAPWLLVETKLGRRFVYNPEKNESFWKFPLDVMKGVVEFDRLKREKRAKPEIDDNNQLDHKDAMITEEILTKVNSSKTSTSAFHEARIIQGEDGEEYEEVEVTDDEDDENPSKRQKTEEGDIDGPVEFNEDDMAYQLAAMGQDYGLDPGEYGDGQDDDLEEGAEGLILTEDDAKALFKDMLDDHCVSPYVAWEKVIEAGQIVHDDRYVVLPNMKSRKGVWAEWSKDRAQILKEQREHGEKRDPRIPFLLFLEKYATPKLYWPEFRRKYKKEAEFRDARLSDKEREKTYRDHISRLKLPESVLKSDLVTLLKSIPLHSLNRNTPPENLPLAILTDIRYISLRSSIRDPLVETYISTLPAAPADADHLAEEQEVLSKDRAERERRDRALAERQKQVQEEKRRQKGALEYSKGVLREGEEEIERAMKISKSGLKGYMEIDE